MREVDNKQIIKLHTVTIATGLPKGCRGASAFRSITNLHHTSRSRTIPKGTLGIVLQRKDVPSERQVGGCAYRALPAGPLAKRIAEQMWTVWDLGKRPSETRPSDSNCIVWA